MVARAEAGERTVPAWLEVIPDKMRFWCIRSRPAPQIDTLVQEQLIVELLLQAVGSTGGRSRAASRGNGGRKAGSRVAIVK